MLRGTGNLVVRTCCKALLILLRVDLALDWDDGAVELGHCQTIAIKDTGLPILRKSLLSKHWSKIGNVASENGEHSGRAA